MLVGKEREMGTMQGGGRGGGGKHGGGGVEEEGLGFK